MCRTSRSCSPLPSVAVWAHTCILTLCYSCILEVQNQNHYTPVYYKTWVIIKWCQQLSISEPIKNLLFKADSTVAGIYFSLSFVLDNNRLSVIQLTDRPGFSPACLWFIHQSISLSSTAQQTTGLKGHRTICFTWYTPIISLTLTHTCTLSMAQ